MENQNSLMKKLDVSLLKSLATLKIANQLTIEKANNGTQLSLINRQDKQLGVILVSKLLSELRYYVPMNAPTTVLADWGDMILSDFWHLKFEELILALKDGSMQKQYGEVLYSNIAEWIKAYEQKKSDYLLDQHTKIKASPIEVENLTKKDLEELIPLFEKPKTEKLKEITKLTQEDYIELGVIRTKEEAIKITDEQLTGESKRHEKNFF